MRPAKRVTMIAHLSALHHGIMIGGVAMVLVSPVAREQGHKSAAGDQGIGRALVWRFRSPHHSSSESEVRTSEPKPH